MGTNLSTRSLIQLIQIFLTFICVSLCLFLLSILTYYTLQRHLIPITHLDIPIVFGFPPTFHSNEESIFVQSPPNHLSHLISYTNLSDPMYDRTPLDISDHSYSIELICHLPRTYRNRQLGSFFVQLLLYSTSKQLIIEHSRLILFPYQSELIRLLRTLILLPLSIFHIDYDRWHLKQILIERLINHDKSKRYVDIIQLNIIPPTFQLDQCSIHFHILDLTGFAYLFVNYPILTGGLSIFIFFSTYLTFYLVITSLTMLNQTNNEGD